MSLESVGVGASLERRHYHELGREEVEKLDDAEALRARKATTTE